MNDPMDSDLALSQGLDDETYALQLATEDQQWSLAGPSMQPVSNISTATAHQDFRGGKLHECSAGGKYCLSACLHAPLRRL